MIIWDSGKCHLWRHKNTSKKEGWEEKWERKKEMDFYDVTRDNLGFLILIEQRQLTEK